MSTPRITDAERAALDVARAAVEGRASAYGPVDAIVFALGSAQLLRAPGEATALERLQQERAESNAALAATAEERGRLAARLAELAPYEELHPQECERGQHRGWFAVADGPLPCPWCRIAELEDTEGEHFRAAHGDIVLGTYMVPEAAAAACEAHLYAHQDHVGPLQWQPHPDQDGVLQLVASTRRSSSPTGFTVTTVTVEPTYDPEAEG